jgi:glycosyltransferase involved in cell wall biosynthesis
LVRDNIDGILVEKNNSEQMTAAIIKLISENNQELSIAARKKVETFRWEVVKEEWFKILL